MMFDPSIIPSVTFRRCYEYETYNAAMALCGRQGYLSPVSSEDFDSGRAYLSEDGLCGYRIVGEDLRSVFNCSPVKGSGQSAVLDAIANGARTLDCFDGFLPAYYRRFGFVAIKRLAFADEYAPPAWNFEDDGRPDVVLMRYHGGNPANLRTRIEEGYHV